MYFQFISRWNLFFLNSTWTIYSQIGKVINVDAFAFSHRTTRIWLILPFSLFPRNWRLPVLTIIDRSAIIFIEFVIGAWDQETHTRTHARTHARTHVACNGWVVPYGNEGANEDEPFFPQHAWWHLHHDRYQQRREMQSYRWPSSSQSLCLTIL